MPKPDKQQIIKGQEKKDNYVQNGGKSVTAEGLSLAFLTPNFREKKDQDNERGCLIRQPIL